MCYNGDSGTGGWADGHRGTDMDGTNIPTTSETLLRNLGESAQHPRWKEFVERYSPMLHQFLAGRYAAAIPEADRDELLQETFLAVMKILPDYRYCPEEKGAFHNYLTGILNKKALGAIRKGRSRSNGLQAFGQYQQDQGLTQADGDIPGTSGEEWERTVFRIAVQQLFADPAVNARHKEIFRRVALEGEKPEAVAASMACSLDVVYQVCSRLKKRLQGVVEALARAEEP